ncbi:MAG TPA: hypothetical protein DCP28_17205, partial [Cytophagales bacterium]|nr:hypothetical protein [Cytophagales bacterium]
TREFYGDFYRGTPSYLENAADVYNDYLDLSVNIIDRQGMGVHSYLDRLYAEYVKDNWEIRAGRQRINWGQNLAWNPNDVFVAYSFFDFDYEERPGSDAVRVKYYTGISGSVEIASNVADTLANYVAAAMWKFNVKGYDVQVLGGYARQDVVAGLGWAGNLGPVGFKGEGTYFHPAENLADTSGVVVASISADYSFNNGFFLSGAGFYNSGGGGDQGLLGLGNVTSGRLTAKNLLPYEWAGFLTAGYPISPLLNASLTGMFFPGDSGLFLNPGLTVSVFENFDMDAIGQLFFGENPVSGDYEALQKAIFVRLKYSY